MPEISHSQIKEMKNFVERTKARLEKVKEQTAEAMAQVVQTTEIGATAFGFGFARGRYGDITLPFGIPIDLGAGVVLHALAFMGAAGAKYDEHLHNFGDGALASYLTFLGASFGGAKLTKSAGEQYYVSGDQPPAGFMSPRNDIGAMSAEQLQAVLNAALRKAARREVDE